MLFIWQYIICNILLLYWHLRFAICCVYWFGLLFLVIGLVTEVFLCLYFQNRVYIRVLEHIVYAIVSGICERLHFCFYLLFFSYLLGFSNILTTVYMFIVPQPYFRRTLGALAYPYNSTQYTKGTTIPRYSEFIVFIMIICKYRNKISIMSQLR